MAESKMPWEQAASEICKTVESAVANTTRKTAEEFYETVMVSVQDYLRENVEFNLSSKLQGYADTARRLRDENEQLKRRADLVEPLVGALEHCQSALAMMTAPDAIKTTSVLHAFAQATEAECKARAALAACRKETSND